MASSPAGDPAKSALVILKRYRANFGDGSCGRTRFSFRSARLDLVGKDGWVELYLTGPEGLSGDWFPMAREDEEPC